MEFSEITFVLDVIMKIRQRFVNLKSLSYNIHFLIISSAFIVFLAPAFLQVSVFVLCNLFRTEHFIQSTDADRSHSIFHA